MVVRTMVVPLSLVLLPMFCSEPTTIIDLESEDEQCLHLGNLKNSLKLVKDENKEDKIFKKRPFNDDDTWNFEIGNIGEFCNGNPTIIEETFGAMKDNEMNQMLAHCNEIGLGYPRFGPCFGKSCLSIPKQNGQGCLWWLLGKM